MNIHERLQAFWAGERPDRIPYTIYHNEWRHTQDDPAWQAMLRAGLGVTYHVSPFNSHTDDLEVVHEEYVEEGVRMWRQRQRTSIGELTQTWAEGWHRKYLLETPADYRVMAHIVRNTTLTPCYDEFLRREHEIQPYGIALSAIGRTPLQVMLVDYAGLEQFVFHLADYEEEVCELYDALLANFRRAVRIAADGPGRFVSNLENFTAESLGPRRYKQFLLPVYEECFPLLREKGKIVGSHYDGRTASCRELIARAPIDLIESLTEPNEGDQTLAEARAAWPDKLFWVNIRVGDYELPPAKLRERVHEMIDQAAVDGRQLAFEVSERYPDNWRESVPVVLAALAERG